MAEDFPALWNDPATPQRERRRMAALLIEDVTLIKAEQITAHVRFRGGATTTTRTVPRPLPWCQVRQSPPATLQQLHALLDDHTDSEAAAILNERGLRTGAGAPLSTQAIRWLRQRWGVQSLQQRLRALGARGRVRSR